MLIQGSTGKNLSLVQLAWRYLNFSITFSFLLLISFSGVIPFVGKQDISWVFIFLPTTYYQFVKCLLIKINQIVCQIKMLNLQIIEIRLTLLSSITTLLFLRGWGRMTPRNNMSALRLYHYCGLGGVTTRNNMLVLRLCQIQKY